MSKVQERQRLIRRYKDETGETEIDMHLVAAWAVQKGYPLPKPANPIDLVAKQLTDALRQEVRRDKKTNRPYRANHAVPHPAKDGQTAFWWIDIDDSETTPDSFRKSAVMRREQMVDDGMQLSLDLDHWNSIRPETERVEMPWDLTMDIEIRRASLDDVEEVA